jgi:hypothetical protein
MMKMKLMERLRYVRANQAVYAYWVKCNEWTNQQAAFLLAGYHPDPLELFNDESQADIDVLTEISSFLAVTDQLSDGPHTPETWIQFALERGLPIPEPLARFFPDGCDVFQRCEDLERELSNSRAEIAALQKAQQDAAAEEKPIATRERHTLLTIIAALCDYSAINHQERGAALSIMQMTDEIRAHVDEGTILAVLKKIPDALATRKK